MLRSFIAVAMVLSVVPGCDPEGSDSPEHFIEAAAPLDIAAQAEDEGRDESAAILAEVELSPIARLRFVDESVSIEGGGIGILGFGPVDFSTVRELTPLELFMAVAPDEDVPERLREHHRQLAEDAGDLAAAPRRFQRQGEALAPLDDLAAPPRRLFTQTTGTWTVSACGGWSGAFCSDITTETWCDSASNLEGDAYVTTGTAFERWLGACLQTSPSAILWEVQYELGGFWTLVSGTSTGLTALDWVQYTSSGSLLQYRAKISGTQPGEKYSAGAARG